MKDYSDSGVKSVGQNVQIAECGQCGGRTMPTLDVDVSICRGCAVELMEDCL